MFKLILLLVLCLFCCKEVYCRGLFEVRLIMFSNPDNLAVDGSCCKDKSLKTESHCVSCRVKFRVCLNHYDKKLDIATPCTFGEYTTPVIRLNNIVFPSEGVSIHGYVNPIQLPFDFKWPGAITMIVEVWHDNYNLNKSNSLSDDKQLIMRSLTQQWVQADRAWTSIGHGSFIYEYRMRCDQYYYGNGCNVLCIPRDDNFGHYTCSATGEKICKGGWKGQYCSQKI